MPGHRPDHIPTIAAVMTPFPWYIHIDDRLSRAREVMEENRIRHLPVTEDGALVGVVTERDVRLLEGTGRANDLAVRSACVHDAYVVDVSAPLDDVLIEMAERHLGSALVVKNEKLAGIFTVTDACRSFGEFLRTLFPDPADDAA